METTKNKNRYYQRAKYICADIVSAIVVWLLFLIFRWVVNDGFVFSYNTVLIPAFSYYTPLFLYPIACLCVYYLSGYYVHIYKKSLGKDFFVTFISSAIISLSAFFVIVLDDVVINYQRYYVSLFTLFMLQFVVSYLFRMVITLHTRQMMKKGLLSLNTVIIGTGQNAQRISKELGKNYENKVIGFITPEKKPVAIDTLGYLKDFSVLKEKYSIDSVVVALDDDTAEVSLFNIINKLYPYGVEIQFIPRIYEILMGVARIHRLELGPLVSITEHSMSDWEFSVKQAIDILASFLALVVFSPIMLVCAICIKKETKGRVFYKQERIGLYGKPFKIIKFRTMYENAETNTPQLSHANDERVTKVGHFLRKYRIDEMPQFWNVLVGDMSLVGPRPERKYYIEKIMEKAPYYCLLYKIRPGLTSWGPIKIGYTDTLEKMVERLNYDIIYMDNMSLLVDIKILLYTIEVIVKGKGQ